MQAMDLNLMIERRKDKTLLNIDKRQRTIFG
jgi:hypothetical protein